MKTRSQNFFGVSAIFLATFLACVLVLAKWKSGATRSITALAARPMTTAQLTAKLGNGWGASLTAPRPQVLMVKAERLGRFPDETQISNPFAEFEAIGPRAKPFGLPDYSVDLFDFRHQPSVRVEELR